LLSTFECAAAELISFRIQGTVMVLDEGLLPPGIVTGMPFTATLTYDLATPDRFPDDPQRGQYAHSPGRTDVGLDVVVGPLEFRSDRNGEFDLRISNDLPRQVSPPFDPGDALRMSPIDVVGTLPFEHMRLSLVLRDLNSQAFSSDSLPTTLNPSAFAEAAVSVFGLSVDTAFSIEGRPRIIQQVPEPATGAMLGVAVAILIWHKRMS
jgi:hypothetical protein